jgi:hypothetical protein
LRLHDRHPIALEIDRMGTVCTELLSFSDQPSKEILEGFDWERRLPVGSSDGLGRGAIGACHRPLCVSAPVIHDLSRFDVVFVSARLDACLSLSR